jgi:hypothetical protein
MSDDPTNPAHYFLQLSERLKGIEANGLAANKIGNISGNLVASLKDLVLLHLTTVLQTNHPNPLNKFGQKCFSQTDEDGITLEIVRRLGLESGVFVEFGVQNGLECNTIVLGALGWKGFWVGGENLAFDHSKTNRLNYIKDWITLKNIATHTSAGLSSLNATDIDVLSLDLDGNDIHFAEELLAGNFRPKLFIVEYNAKFMPPTKFQIKYDENHRWVGDDYFGAALINFVELFERFNYTLICCNSHTGANAFFIKNEYMCYFKDVPEDIRSIYVGPRYYMFNRYGHRLSPRVVETIFSD